jgi:hypothetical protein
MMPSRSASLRRALHRPASRVLNPCAIAWSKVQPKEPFINTHRRFIAIGLLCAAAHTAAVAASDPRTVPGATAAQRDRYADAAQWFRQSHYAAAYGRIAALADAGHVPAAHLALVMHDQGHALFGSEWSASPGQRRRWNTLVINSARQRVELPDNERGD